MQKCIATYSLDKVFVGYTAPTPKWIWSPLLWYLRVLDFLDPSWQSILLPAEYLLNVKRLKTIARVISFFDGICPAESGVITDFWLKTTSWVDVNAVYRSQRMVECEMVWRLTTLSRATYATPKTAQVQKMNKLRLTLIRLRTDTLASSSMEEVSYCFSSSSVKFQGHTGRNIDLGLILN